MSASTLCGGKCKNDTDCKNHKLDNPEVKGTKLSGCRWHASKEELARRKAFLEQRAPKSTRDQALVYEAMKSSSEICQAWGGIVKNESRMGACHDHVPPAPKINGKVEPSLPKREHTLQLKHQAGSRQPAALRPMAKPCSPSSRRLADLSQKALNGLNQVKQDDVFTGEAIGGAPKVLWRAESSDCSVGKMTRAKWSKSPETQRKGDYRATERSKQSSWPARAKQPFDDHENQSASDTGDSATESEEDDDWETASEGNADTDSRDGSDTDESENNGTDEVNDNDGEIEVAAKRVNDSQCKNNNKIEETGDSFVARLLRKQAFLKASQSLAEAPASPEASIKRPVNIKGKADETLATKTAKKYAQLRAPQKDATDKTNGADRVRSQQQAQQEDSSATRSFAADRLQSTEPQVENDDSATSTDTDDGSVYEINGARIVLGDKQPTTTRSPPQPASRAEGITGPKFPERKRDEKTVKMLREVDEQLHRLTYPAAQGTVASEIASPAVTSRQIRKPRSVSSAPTSSVAYLRTYFRHADI